MSLLSILKSDRQKDEKTKKTTLSQIDDVDKKDNKDGKDDICISKQTETLHIVIHNKNKNTQTQHLAFFNEILLTKSFLYVILYMQTKDYIN